jgi:adenylate kinase
VKKNFVFLGPPGSGKGTQALRLADKLSVAHLSTGDILRNAVKAGTQLGKQAESYMTKGELVPDHLLVSLIESKVTAGDLDGGFILDGFPRTVPQAASLEEMFRKNKVSLDAVILFDVSDEEVVRRLSGRWFCPRCQATYNYPAHVPRREGICDRSL